MRRGINGFLVVGLLLGLSGLAFGVDAEVDGVVPGKWTMDLDAAKEMAKKEDLPILLNFTGSDWCGWCKLMERNVFSQEAWEEYAKTDCLMVMLDFPRGAGLVPQKYVARNQKLKSAYGVSGYPTYILLDSDGETVLGRLGAGREKTAETFIGELTALTRYRTGEIELLAKEMDPEDAAAYRKLASEIKSSQEAIKERKETIATAKEEIKDLEKRVETRKAEAAEFRAAQAGEESLKEYRQLKAALEAAEKERMAWLATGPKRTEENSKKNEEMLTRIQEISSRLAEF